MHLRRWFRHLEPRVLASLNGPLLSRWRPWLDQHEVFNFNRNPLALGVAIGMFCGLIPGPLQIGATLLLCAWWRGNLIAGAIATFYTNPLTIVPLYALAWQIGQWVLPGNHTLPTIGGPGNGHWASDVLHWMQALGWPLAAGLPLLGLGLALLAWLLVQGFWLAPVYRRLWARRRFIKSRELQPKG